MASSQSSSDESKVKKLLEAASTGRLHLLRKMAEELDKGKGTAETLKEVKDSEGCGAFHLAAAGGSTEICWYFVEELDIHVDFRSERGETPLYHAAKGGHLVTAMYLIGHGAVCVAVDIEGLTPLHCAAQHGKHEMVELLLSLAVPVDLELTAATGTALTLAAMQGHAKTVEVLLEHDANVDKAANTMHTPLVCAVCSGSLECTKLIIEAGADLNLKCPLEIAICCESIEIVKCLLKAGADPNTRSERGLLPIETAAMKGKSEIVEMLFPLTCPFLESQNWNVKGILQHVKTDAFKEQTRIKAEVRSSELKVKGADAIKKNDYRAALGIYSTAIKIDPTNATLFSNRSMCWHRLGAGHRALKDAEMAVSLKPNWPKAYYRVGAAFMLLKEYDHASKAYLDALAFGDNEEIEDAFWYALDCRDRVQRGLEIQSYSKFSEPVDPGSLFHLPPSHNCCLFGDHEDTEIVEVGYAFTGEDGEMHETVITSENNFYW